MSRCTNLVLILSLAACGGPTIQPQKPPDLVPAKTAPEPIPVPVAAPEPEPAPPPTPEVATPPPAPEPVVEAKPDPAPQVTPKKVLVKKKCNPMSRAGCRWSEEQDERDNVRVTKKQGGDAGK